jgi:hypothetical protein
MKARILVSNRDDASKFPLPISPTAPALPRKDDIILVNGISYVVQSVTWEYNETTVGVYDSPIITVSAR